MISSDGTFHCHNNGTFQELQEVISIGFVLTMTYFDRAIDSIDSPFALVLQCIWMVQVREGVNPEPR